MVPGFLRCLSLRDNGTWIKIASTKDGQQQKLILMDRVSDGRIFDFFAFKNNGIQWAGQGTDNIAKKAISNKHGLHLFRPSHINGGC